MRQPSKLKIKEVQKDCIKTKRPKPMRRGSRDDFQTPKCAIDILLPFLNKNWTIWECACGKGNLHEAFNQEGFRIIATDILQDVDFLNYPYKNKTDFKFQCIIT